MEKFGYVYILTNRQNRVLYTGVTSNLRHRMWEHNNKKFTGFTKEYNLDKLVYCEMHLDIRPAIAREKQIKGGSRDKKCALINKKNPAWDDLSKEWF